METDKIREEIKRYPFLYMESLIEGMLNKKTPLDVVASLTICTKKVVLETE